MSNTTGAIGGLPIDKLITQPSTNAPTAAASLTSQLGPDAFLKLLTTQLQNQDPMHPVDDTTSIAQLAQFSATQSIDDLKTSFANFQSTFGVMQTAGLIGKTATVSTADASGNASSVTGTISSIAIVNGAPQIALTGSNGKAITDSNGQPITFATNAILGIK